MTKPSIFIDGEHGTTGLEIRKRLEGRDDIELISLAHEKRKDTTERKKLLNEANLSILCLPDEASRDAVALITNPRAKVIDASSAHRTADGWVYGFPELLLDQDNHIRAAKRVTNPGCYPTGALAFIRPLTDAELLPKAHGLTITAVSGYSGGGKELIDICKNQKDNPRGGPFSAYGLDQKHKHIPEIKYHGGLSEDPIFLPSYSSALYRGMLIEIALRLKKVSQETGRAVSAAEIHAVLEKRYAGRKYIKLEPLETNLQLGYVLTPTAQNDTNNLQLRVIHNPEKDIVVLVACLDNLGKGASGAAVQNMNLMLGFQD